MHARFRPAEWLRAVTSANACKKAPSLPHLKIVVLRGVCRGPRAQRQEELLSAGADFVATTLLEARDQLAASLASIRVPVFGDYRCRGLSTGVLLRWLLHALREQRVKLQADLLGLALEFVQELALLVVDLAVGEEHLPQPGRFLGR